MKVFEPFRTYSSPPHGGRLQLDTSERLRSESEGKHRFFEQRRQPLRLLLLAAGDDHRAEQAVRADRGAVPEQPQLSSSPTRIPSKWKAEPAGDSGTCRFIKPSSCALAPRRRVGLVLVILRRLGPDLLLGELASKLAQTLLSSLGANGPRADTLSMVAIRDPPRID
jgi:hypothetical protein